MIMKRRYISPKAMPESIDSQLMSTSNSVNAEMGNTQIKYGGVDVDGSLDPAARYLDIWDDEEEEEEDW